MQSISTSLDQTTALAGIFQAALLVQRIARVGDVPDAALRTTIASTLQIDAPSVVAVFGDTFEHLHLGFVTLQQQLGGGDGRRDVEVSRYVSELMALERNLARRTDLVDTLQHGLRRASNQLHARTDGAPVHDPELLGPAVLGTLADAYKETLSNLSPRIMVSGEPSVLRDAGTADRIRATLLAGIRATVLWRQLGGRRLHLVFRRNRILRTARTALAGSN
ncbi:MAG: high frequency lysogenization protein HflD [Pseudomonadota bacterium]